jgi:hypothetical protein
MSNAEVDFTQWVDGIASIEEDHVFTPIGRQTKAMTDLLNERAALLDRPAVEAESGEHVQDGERALGETYTERRDELDALIEEQLEQDHPDAPRIRIRALSDEDIEAIDEEVRAIKVAGKLLDRTKAVVEANLRIIARASVQPPMTPEDVRVLRRKLNRGEYARLLDHVNRISLAEAEAVDLPN